LLAKGAVALGAGALCVGALGCHREEERATRAAASVPVPDAQTPVRVSADTAPTDVEAVSPRDAADENQTEKAFDPANKIRPPLVSADLEARAAHLLEAIAQNEPGTADDFFFPRAPFIPLKDVSDPGRYFDQLLTTYHRDIRSLRAERTEWEGVAFVSFELGTTPTWVAPGKEYNKIGYFRTFGGKLRYRIGDKVKELAVSTIISWDGRWYVTHLSPIRH